MTRTLTVDKEFNPTSASENSDVQIMQGDCLEKLLELEKSSVHLVVTDPPYFTDGLGNVWEKGNKKSSNGVIGGLPVGMKFDKKQGISAQNYMEKVFEKLYPIMCNGAFACVFSQPRLSHRVAVGIEEAGFEVRDILAWRYTKRAQFKAFTLNHFVDKEDYTEVEKENIKSLLAGRKTPQLRPQFETIILAQKPREGTFLDNWIKYKTGLIDPKATLDGKVPQTIMTVEKPLKDRYNGHLTVKPVQIIEHLINLFSVEGQTVLDPFLGSGTTLVACKKTKRKGLGIEINSDYINIAKKRTREY